MLQMSSKLAQTANGRLHWALKKIGPIGVPPLDLRLEHAHYMNGTVPPGKGVSYHQHQCYQIQTAVSGRFIYEAEDQRIPLEGGESCLVRAHSLHGWRCQSAGVLLGVDVRPNSDSGELEPAFAFAGGQTLLKVSDPLANQDAQELTWTAVREPDGWMREMTRFRLGVWLTRVIPHCLTQGNSAEPTPAKERAGGVNRDKVEQVEAFLRDNFRRPLALADIAREAGLSTRQLTRVFRRERGVTLHAFLLDLRLREGARMLRETPNTSVKQIAYASGFREPGYFARCYREKFGRRPSDDLEDG